MFTSLYRLPRNDVTNLKHVIDEQDNPAFKQRAAALILLSEGHSQDLVAAACGVNTMTLFSWWYRFHEDGIDGLACHPEGDEVELSTVFVNCCMNILFCMMDQGARVSPNAQASKEAPLLSRLLR